MSAWSIYWIVITIILLIALFIKPYIALLIGLILAVAYVFGKKVFFIVNGASVLILLIIAIIYVVRYFINNRPAHNHNSHDSNRWVSVTREYPAPTHALVPEMDRTEDSMLSCAKQFKPRWINRNGKLRLEGGENGNNANLAQHLRDNQIPNVETEITLQNGSRADLMINNQIIIECKPHLLSVEKLHSISGEIRRVKRIGSYKVYALIYGDAKSYLLNDLKADIRKNNVIVLGEGNNSD